MLLADLLQDLEVRVEPLAVCSVAAGWRLRLPSTDSTVVHYVLEGMGSMEVPGHATLTIRPGSVVVVPGVRHHDLVGAGTTRHRVTRRPEDAGAHELPLLAAGHTGPPALRIVCGWVDARVLAAVDVFAPLTEPLVFEPPPSVLRPLFTALLEEANRPGPARRTTVEALMQACLAVTLRSEYEGARDLPPWLGPLMSSRLRPALEHVLDDPGATHTVASLAREAHMSRSAFSNAFVDVIGEPPMAHVRRVRLRRAAAMLRSTDLPVASIAHAVGFSSRSHFSQAFTAVHGVTPSAYRRTPSGGAEREVVGASPPGLS